MCRGRSGFVGGGGASSGCAVGSMVSAGAMVRRGVCASKRRHSVDMVNGTLDKKKLDIAEDVFVIELGGSEEYGNFVFTARVTTTPLELPAQRSYR